MSSDHRSSTQCVISQFALNLCDEMFRIANKKKKNVEKNETKQKQCWLLSSAKNLLKWNCLPFLLLRHFFGGDFNLSHSCKTAECNYTHMNDSETDFNPRKLKFINSKVTSIGLSGPFIKLKYCRTFCPVKIHSNSNSDNITWKAMREWVDAHSHDITCTSNVAQKTADSG